MKLLRKSTEIKKELFLEAYVKTAGVKSLAAKHAGVHRDTIYTWLREDPGFYHALSQAQMDIGDFVEQQLKNLAFKSFDGPSMRFWLEHKHPDFKQPELFYPIAPGEKTFEDIIDALENNKK